VYVAVSKETDTNVTDQSQKKGVYCTDALFLFLFIVFTSYAVSMMDDVTTTTTATATATITFGFLTGYFK